MCKGYKKSVHRKLFRKHVDEFNSAKSSRVLCSLRFAEFACYRTHLLKNAATDDRRNDEDPDKSSI